MFKNKLTILVIIACSLLSSLTMFRSGLNYSFGEGYWGPSGHDGIWHLALVKQFQQKFPPENPTYSGTILSNYHAGYDLLVAILSNLTKIKPEIFIFQVLPIFFSIFIGIFIFLLYSKLFKVKMPWWGFILVYFSSSAASIVGLLKNGHLTSESLFWSMQPASTQLNPPLALSLLVLSIAMYLYFNKTNPLIVGLAFSLLTPIKIYASILVIIALTLQVIFNYFKKLDNSYFVKVYLSLILISLIFIKIFNLVGHANPLIFQPFWFNHTLVESSDKLYLPKLASLRFNLANQPISYKTPVLVIIELCLLLIFIVGNFFTRLFLLYKSNILIKNHNTLFCLFIIPSSIILPTLFVQSGTAWNTIQFLYYGIFISNLLFIRYLQTLNNKIIVIVLIIISCFGSWDTLKGYFGYPPPSQISTEELSALSFLSNQSRGVVLTYPYDKEIKFKDKVITPIPMYLYETTAYLSAKSTQPSYLSDEINLEITGYPWRDRQLQVTNFFHKYNIFQARGFLLNQDITYIYLLNKQNLPFSPVDLGVRYIYNQGDIKIYQVLK